MTAGHVAISSIDWSFLWQGPQEIMAAFARRGERVLYVENTGARQPRWSDWARIVKRARSWGASPVGRAIAATPGVTVLSPLVLPFPWSRAAQAVNRRLLVDRLPALARELGITDPVIWTFLPTPLALDTMRAFRRERSLAAYYCLQDFAQVTDRPDELRNAEARLLTEVDIVFAGGQVLQRLLRPRHPHVVLAPVTVAGRFFAERTAPPRDTLAAKTKRVGYVGGLHRHVDLELIARTMAVLPDVEFVFVGPPQEDVSSIASAANARFVGTQPHEDLPSWIDSFDVCLIPYKRSPFTESVWPTKLHEYLARGRPVVSTDLPEVVGLAYPPWAVRVVSGADAFAAAIVETLQDLRDPREPDRWADRRTLAETYRTDVVITRISVELEHAAERHA